MGGTFFHPPPNSDTPASTTPPSKNLITDPSLELTSPGGLPRGWSRYPRDTNYRCLVAGDGRTGKRSLHIEGEGTRALVFTNGVKLDRTKRYALKGWVKFEGDGNGQAIIKFNYFHNRQHLGPDDAVGISANKMGWQLLEKKDRADDFPEASEIWVSCNLEGTGKAWFDDIELVAYDRDGLADDFDAKHGKHSHAPRSPAAER